MTNRQLSPAFTVTEVRFTAAPRDDQRRGLIGFASFTVNGGLRLSGIAVRRTLARRHALSFPARSCGFGRQEFLVRPLDNRTRMAIEEQVFEALGLKGNG